MNIKRLFTIIAFCAFFMSSIAQQKNVLFILVDDLNTDQAAFGNTAVITPAIDALSQEGIRFDNAQCSWPVCGPSRASFMTGTYPETNGVRNLKTELRDPSPNIVTIPQYLKEIGYITEAVGKVYDPRCIDEDYDYPTSWTTPYSISYDYPEEYGPFVKGQYRVYVAPMDKGPLTEIGPDGVLDDGYIDGQIALDAVNRIESYKNSDKPFFLSVGFKKPHTPFIAPKKYWDLYDISDIEMSDYQKLPEGTGEIAFSTSGEVKAYDDIIVLTSDGTKDGEFTSSVTVNGETFDKVMPEDTQKNSIRGYYASISYIDAQIKMIVDALESNGLKDNTLIILTSDHGFALGDNAIWGKHNILNNSSQVPFIIVDPSREAKVEDRAVQLIDIFPTICHWLDIPYLEQMQGNSVFEDENASTVFPLNLAVTHFRSKGRNGYTFKRSNYRYTLWTNNSAMTDAFEDIDIYEEELYKYTTDEPQAVERINLINDANEAEVLAEIKVQVEKWWKAYNENHTNESEIPGLGVGDLDNNKFNIYPNPSSQYLVIEGGFPKSTQVQIYSVNGKLMSEEKYEDLKDQLYISTETMSKGVYVIKINGVSRKFIKE